jgi:hypothetical protein
MLMLRICRENSKVYFVRENWKLNVLPLPVMELIQTCENLSSLDASIDALKFSAYLKTLSSSEVVPVTATELPE